MNPEDMVKFIKSLNGEQKKQFENIFKTVGETMGVQTTGEESLEINPSESEPTVTEVQKKQMERYRGVWRCGDSQF